MELVPVDHDPFAQGAPPPGGPAITFRFPNSEQPEQPAPQAQLIPVDHDPFKQNSPAAQMAIEHANLLGAASQRTTPHISQHQKNFISSDVFEDDGGNIMYRDPQSGQVVHTDNTKHVVLRDPADSQVKVYARDNATNEGPLTGLARVLAPGLLAGTPISRPALPAALAKVPVPAVEELKNTASAGYQAADRAALGGYHPDMTLALSDHLKALMEAKGSRDYLAPQTFRAVGEIAKDAPTGLQDVRSVRELLGGIGQSADKAERRASGMAIKEIDQFIARNEPKAGPILADANANYSAAMRVKQLENAGEIAGLRAGRAGYGGNAVNTMRQTLSPIVEKAIKGNAKGFSPDEIEAMRNIVMGTPGVNALRTVGQFSPTRGGFRDGMGVLTSVGSLGTLPAVGAMANKLAAVLTSRQIDQLMAKVAKRSPAYAEAVGKAADRFFAARDSLTGAPDAAKFAAFISASRALANGLKRDGIGITSGDLMRYLQSPKPGAAQPDEQPQPGIPGQ